MLKIGDNNMNGRCFKIYIPQEQQQNTERLTSYQNKPTIHQNKTIPQPGYIIIST
jgi:hypothetical protein